LLFLVLILGGNFRGVAQEQSRKELEQKRYEIIQEIDLTNELLELTSKNKKVLLSDLSILEGQIQNRKDLLEQIEKEILLIDRDILSHAFQKEEKQLLVDSLREQYNTVLRAVYRESALQSPIMSILSSESVSTSFLKANVYSRLREYVGSKLHLLQEEKVALESKMEELSGDKEDKRKILMQTQEQSELLANEQARRVVMMASLGEDEAALKADLSVQRSNRENMNKAIEAVLASDFKGETSSANSASTFDKMKGNMGWPVEKGVVTAKYGKQAHPTMRNLTINNNGVDIRAPLQAAVSVVFDGEVVSVSKMSGFGTTVIIDHGKYFTVYSRLESTSLSKGSKVARGQSIGLLEVKEGSSELHFEIWKDNKTQNPEAWLK